MPLFFWLPMIMLGGMLDVAADGAAGRSGREAPVEGRAAPTPASDAVMASLQADARMAKADHQVNDAKDRSQMQK
jgi:hypothetical protein